MPQSTILAAGTTAATSTDIVLAAGDTATVGIFAATAIPLPAGEQFTVVQVTPGAANYVGMLTNNERSVQIVGPGTFQVKRPVTTAAFGVFLEV
jgi:hypothetical protein